MPVDSQLIRRMVVSAIAGRPSDVEGCQGRVVESEGVAISPLLRDVRSQETAELESSEWPKPFKQTVDDAHSALVRI
jgi:hypothetical protein